MDYSTIIDRLEDDIRRFRIEYQRFFNGDIPAPPEGQSARLRKKLTSLIGQPQLTAVDQFRLGALESRYNSYTELFRRRLRDMNLAHGASAGGMRAEDRTAAVDLSSNSRAEEVEGLFQAIYAERSTKIDLSAFHAYLVDRAAEVRRRTGCEKVRFSIDAESGVPKLKARPLRHQSD